MTPIASTYSGITRPANAGCPGDPGDEPLISQKRASAWDGCSDTQPGEPGYQDPTWAAFDNGVGVGGPGGFLTCSSFDGGSRSCQYFPGDTLCGEIGTCDGTWNNVIDPEYSNCTGTYMAIAQCLGLVDPGTLDGSLIVAVSGPPMPGIPCTSMSGANSIPVGDVVGSVVSGNPSERDERMVVDINTISIFANSKIEGPSKVFAGLRPVGWIYKDNGGQFWFQKDPSANWSTTVGIGLTLGGWFTLEFGITPPPDSATYPLGSSPGKTGDRGLDHRCFSDGSLFIGPN